MSNGGGAARGGRANASRVGDARWFVKRKEMKRLGIAGLSKLRHLHHGTSKQVARMSKVRTYFGMRWMSNRCFRKHLTQSSMGDR